MKQQVMIIGNNLVSCKHMKYSLQDDRIQIYYTLSLEDGLRHLIHYGYQLVILDVETFDNHVMRTLTLLRKARHTPLLVILPEKDKQQIVEILSVADGFLHKELDLEVFRATISALLRRDFYPLQTAPGVYSGDGTLMISTTHRKVFVLNTEIDLPRKQYELLYLLASHEGQVFTRSQLLEKVWGHDADNNDNTLYCQMKKLRNNLKSIKGAPEYIKTIRGVGYSFVT